MGRGFVLFGLGTIATIVIACSSENADKPEPCTPGAYVFCRCQDREKGTKLCHDDGISFDACVCNGSGSELQKPAEKKNTPAPTPADENKTSGDKNPKDAGGGGSPVETRDAGGGGNNMGPLCEALAECCDNLRPNFSGSAGNCDKVVARRDEGDCYEKNVDYKTATDDYDPVCF